MTNDLLLQLGIDHAIQIAIVALLAIALTAVLRRHSRLCWAIWLVVLVKCVTPPVVQHQVSVFQWTDGFWDSVTSQWADAETLSAELVQTQMEATLIEGFQSPAANGSANSSSERLHSVSADVTVRRLGEIGGVQHLAVIQTSWSRWLLIGFCSLSLCSFLLLLVRYVRCHRQLRRRETLDFDDRIQGLLADVSAAMAVTKLPRIMVTDARFGPAVIGVFRPLIVLPRLLVQQLDDETLKLVIAHELIHIRQGDLFVGMLQAVAHSLWWFHPFVWVINGRISRLAEQCCDEQVLSETGCSARQYAQSLLAVIECRSRLVPVPIFPGMKPVEITQQRLERIMTLKQGRSRRNKVASVAMMITLSILVLPGALTATSQDKTTQDKPKEWKRLPGTQLPKVQPPKVQWPVEYFGAGLGPAAPKVKYQKYDVADLVFRMCEQPQITLLDATLKIQQKLRLAARTCQSEQADAKGTFPPTPFVIAPHAKGTYQWKLGTTSAGHDAVAQTLSLLRTYGFARIKIKATIFSADPTVMAETIRKAGVQLKPVRTSQQSSGIEFGVLQLNSQLPNSGSHVRSSDIVPVAFSETRIRRSVPISTAVAAQQTAVHFVDSAKNNQMIKLLSSPEFVTFNGHDAWVATGESRPFVTGFDQGQAQLQIATTGLWVSVTPRLRADGVELTCGVRISSISDVDTQKVAVVGKRGKQTIQIPEVMDQTVRATVLLQSNETFVVTGLTRETEDGEIEEVVVLLKAEELKPEPSVPSAVKPAGQRMSARAYNVADLVAPIANRLTLDEVSSPPKAALQSDKQTSGPDDGKEVSSEINGEAAKLIELIRTTVSPESWDPKIKGEVWGHGTMAFSENSLAIVIRHTPKVHEQIADLLYSLQRQKDYQVTTEVWSIATKPSLPAAWNSLRFTETHPGFSWAMATSQQLEALDASLQKHQQHFTASDRVKVTAFDRQGVDLPIKFADFVAANLDYEASILSGNKLMALSVKLNSTASTDSDTDSKSLSTVLSSGTTLVLKYRPTVTVGVPVLEDIPAISALFSNRSRSADGEDMYIFLTPQIVDVSELDYVK